MIPKGLLIIKTAETNQINVVNQSHDEFCWYS